ncbi:MAG: hypothetical protein HQM08_25785 [Candidatus Riflebacteria bacterium]|nr:hypothetical protein [Candidatus Riflebacteria bacterium]
MNCEKIKKNLAENDEYIPNNEDERHISSCRSCQALCEKDRKILAGLAAIRRYDSLPSGFSSKVINRIKYPQPSKLVKSSVPANFKLILVSLSLSLVFSIFVYMHVNQNIGLSDQKKESVSTSNHVICLPASKEKIEKPEIATNENSLVIPSQEKNETGFEANMIINATSPEIVNPPSYPVSMKNP